jgi:hypothetical protein
MICCYTNATDANVPPMAWVREVYDFLPRKYKKNLKHLHVVHPSWLMKVPHHRTTRQQDNETDTFGRREGFTRPQPRLDPQRGHAFLIRDRVCCDSQWFLSVFISPKFFSKVIPHDDLATLEMAVAWEEMQLPDWVDEYNRQLYGRPPRPPPENKNEKKKKKAKQLGVKDSVGAF